MKKIKTKNKEKQIIDSKESKKYLSFGIILGALLLATGIILSYVLVS